MDYISLNNKNRKRIKSICTPTIEMNWEEPELLDIIAGSLPKIRESSYDSEIIAQLTELKEYYRSYDFIKSDTMKKVIGDLKYMIRYHTMIQKRLI